MKEDCYDPGPALDSAQNAQWWLMYTVLVANKSAEFANQRLNAFFPHGTLFSDWDRPFTYVRLKNKSGLLRSRLIEVKTGQYNRVEAAFVDMAVKLPPLAGDDPRKWTLITLESIPGVGPKSARWFYGLVNPEAKVAALDTHILKFLGDNGSKVPKATPSAGARYHELEADFIYFADRLDMNPPELDYLLWKVYRKGGRVVIP